MEQGEWNKEMGERSTEKGVLKGLYYDDLRV